MPDGDWYIAKRILTLRVAGEQGPTHPARPRRPGGLAWHSRWLVCRLGYQLVALGAWLEAYSLPEAQPVRVES
jgi:hypothetical protein